MPYLLTLALLAFLAACADPERPVFELPDGGSDDTTPPLILFAQSDTVIAIGDTLSVGVRVIDRTGIVRVAASASGAVNFGFPAAQPNDTVFDAQFPIPTASATPGVLNFTVVARDLLGNQTTGLKSFTLR